MAAVNVTADHCAATITTRYGAMTHTNLVSLAHFPMTAVIVEHEPR